MDKQYYMYVKATVLLWCLLVYKCICLPTPASSAAATVDVDSSVTSHSEQPDPPIRKEVCQGQPQHSETPSTSTCTSTVMCLHVVYM